MTALGRTPRRASEWASWGVTALQCLVMVVGVVLMSRAIHDANVACDAPAARRAVVVGMSATTAIVFALAFVGIPLALRPQRQRRARAVPVDGVVVDREPLMVKGRTTITEQLVIRYQMLDGTPRQSRVKPPRAGIATGDHLPVRYDPDDPDWITADAGEYERLLRRLALGGIVTIALALVTLGLALHF